MPLYYSGQPPHLYYDNFAIAAGVRKTSICGSAMHPLCAIAMLVAINDVQISSRWIPTKTNHLANLLFCDELMIIANKFPHFTDEDHSERDPPESWYAEVFLNRQFSRYLWWDLVPKTRLLYETVRLGYTIYCQTHTSFTLFLATLASLASWISAMGNRQLRTKIIMNHMSGIRSLHIDQGYDNLKLFYHPVLQRIVAGIKRKNGDPNTQERLSITRDLLLKLLPTLD